MCDLLQELWRDRRGGQTAARGVPGARKGETENRGDRRHPRLCDQLPRVQEDVRHGQQARKPRQRDVQTGLQTQPNAGTKFDR